MGLSVRSNRVELPALESLGRAAEGPPSNSPLQDFLANGFRLAIQVAPNRGEAEGILEETALATHFDLAEGVVRPDARIRFYRELLRSAERREWLEPRASDFESADAATLPLPPRLRAAVALQTIEGFTYGQLACALGCDLETARAQLHRGRALVREGARGDEAC